MIERFTPKGPVPKIAMITTVSAFVESLTGLDSLRFNRRGLHAIRLTPDHAAKAGYNIGDAIVDLFFVPAITGDYSLEAKTNVDEIERRLCKYDLIVDLCEFSALYRRGITTAADIEVFKAAYPGADLNLLEYKNFLDVIKALHTTFDAVFGRVVRPESVVDIRYEWGVGRNGKLAITRMDKHGVTPRADDMWCPLQNGGESMLMDAAAEGDRPGLRVALGALRDNGMETLETKVMFSGYLSDMAGIQRTLVESTEPSFTFTLQNIFAARRAKYLPGFEDGTKVPSDIEQGLLDGISAVERDIEKLGLNFSLVDYYRISGGPAGDVDDETLQRYLAFLNMFEAGMAFVRHWDMLEDTQQTVDMNTLVNGWYMSNSCFGLLRDANRAGLAVPVTSWGIPTLVTNSVGFIPSADKHAHGIRSAVYGGLTELLSQLAVA